MEWIEKIVWHKVVIRPPTEEEIEGFAEDGLAEYEYPLYMFSCELPDENREILVLGKSGDVSQDTCMLDDGYDGYSSYYLDNLGDWDDVVAWAYMQTGKKDEEATNAS
jgi:hypothetical protein